MDVVLGKAVIINMQDIEVEDVNWLWYPYIPFGKITVVQGDPGNGKTTFILAVSSIVTNGLSFPATNENTAPANIIYQTAEDGLADTIKPRLLQYGADCSKVFVIDDSLKQLTLDDGRIEESVNKVNAKVLVIDPLQAFLGADVDMHRANEIRPIFKKIGRCGTENWLCNNNYWTYEQVGRNKRNLSWTWHNRHNRRCTKCIATW